MTLASRSVCFLFVMVFAIAGLCPAEGQFTKRVAKPAAPAEAEEKAAETEQSGRPLTLWQARKQFMLGLQSTYGMTGDAGSYRFTMDGVQFSAHQFRHKNSESYKVEFKTLPEAWVKRGFGGVYRLKNLDGEDLPEPFNKLMWYSGNSWQSAESMAKAVNRLREMSGEPGAALRDFPKAAAAWRALPAKPAISEDVRAQRVLAEAAFKEGNLNKALYHYERGVELYPVWAEGRFNAALIASELKFYDEAVEHMRAYLELAPDSPDAVSARDQVVIWQDKATQQTEEAPAATAQPSVGRKKSR